MFKRKKDKYTAITAEISDANTERLLQRMEENASTLNSIFKDMKPEDLQSLDTMVRHEGVQLNDFLETLRVIIKNCRDSMAEDSKTLKP